jgi:hypothetical protein
MIHDKANLVSLLHAVLPAVQYYDEHEGCPCLLRELEDAIANPPNIDPAPTGFWRSVVTALDYARCVAEQEAPDYFDDDEHESNFCDRLNAIAILQEAAERILEDHSPKKRKALLKACEDAYDALEAIRARIEGEEGE